MTSKSKSFFIVGLFLAVAAISFYLAPLLMGRSQAQASPTYDSVITLVLPDQEYVLYSHELMGMSGELVVPSLAVPADYYYQKDQGIVLRPVDLQDYVLSYREIADFAADHTSEKEISFRPTYALRARPNPLADEYNLRLNKIYRTPLTISLKDGRSFIDLALDSSLLRTLIVPHEVDLAVPPVLDKSAFLSHVTSRLTKNQEKYFSADASYANAQKALNARFLGDSTPFVLGVDDGPTSHGELAPKYLEVDLSQQKMYFFINGELYQSYHISTGIDFPTPVGEYHILNKAPKAFSDIYNVWMPYWMGFTYAKQVGAYLGLHEIAYAVDPKGKPVYRHGYYIGEMMTGGCVAMEPKDSREIYNLSDVGMLIRIVK